MKEDEPKAHLKSCDTRTMPPLNLLTASAKLSMASISKWLVWRWMAARRAGEG